MKTNVYSLATNYDVYSSPQNSPLKENCPKNIPLNIFHQQLLQRSNPKDIFSSKKYQMVGIKELRSLQFKMRKGTKYYKKDFHSREERPLSKDQHKHSKPDLLTGREVIDTLPKVKQVQPNNEDKKIKRKHWITQLYNPHKSCHKTISDANSSVIVSEFSVNRLKITMNQRKDEWDILVSKAARQNNKFPSIYQSTDMYRYKMQEKSANAKLEDITNLNSTLWEKTLRNSHQQTKLTSKKLPIKTVHDNIEFTTRGSSKLKLEEDWLEKKEEEGYQFKKYPSQIPHCPLVNETIK